MGEKIIDLIPLEYPKDLALLSFNVKRLKPKQELVVKINPQRLENYLKWAAESGNKVEPMEENLIKVVRGKGFHGICLGEKISFYALGVKLHLKEFLFKLTGKYPPYLVNFVSINEGFRTVEKLKDFLSNREYEILPAPKEVEGYCGLVVGFNELKDAEEFFNKALANRCGVEILFRSKDFQILKKAWER
jgi:hypothetical protein